MAFYKILSHDLRPPLQGGDPLPINGFPFETPAVKLNTSEASCAAGWHCVEDLAAGFQIAGLWRDGHPARAFEVEPSDDVIQRGNKFRASRLTIVSELDLEGIERGVHGLSKPFGRYRRSMVKEQMAWYVALGRPEHDPEKVEDYLHKALKARGLKWEVKEYKAAWAARNAWDAWAARDARNAWDAWNAWAARNAWDAWDAWAARDARNAWAAWDARNAWDAWAARDALCVTYAAKQGWTNDKPSLLTTGITGIRDAYRNGLELAIPTGPSELGFSMVPKP